MAAPRNASVGHAEGDEFAYGAFFAVGGERVKRQLAAGVVAMSAVLEGHDQKEATYFCDYAPPARRNARESYLSADAVSKLHSSSSGWFPLIPALSKSRRTS